MNDICHKLQTAESDLYKQNLKCRAFQKRTSLVLESSLADGTDGQTDGQSPGSLYKIISQYFIGLERIKLNNME